MSSFDTTEEGISSMATARAVLAEAEWWAAHWGGEYAEETDARIWEMRHAIAMVEQRQGVSKDSSTLVEKTDGALREAPCNPFAEDDYMQALEKKCFAEGVNAAANLYEDISDWHRDDIAKELRALAAQTRASRESRDE